jgi:hypothetical protein
LKAWEVIAITVDGEIVCRGCAKDDEKKAFSEPVDDIGVVFASDANDDETCTRCGERLV